MNRFYVVLLISALFFLGAAAQTTEPVQDPATGHCYEVVSSGVLALNFSSALTNATGRVSNNGAAGYLATINSTAEEAFIFTLITTSASVSYYTGALAVGSDYVWQAGPEAGVVVYNNSGCQQSNCFGLSGTVVAGSAISLFNRTFVANSDSLLLGFLVEYDSCSPSPSSSISPSAAASASPTTGGPTTTAGATVSPSTFRPTITLGTLSTTGKKTTTGRKATSSSVTTGRRATTGKISAASSMSLSVVAVAIAAASMMFLRR